MSEPRNVGDIYRGIPAIRLAYHTVLEAYNHRSKKAPEGVTTTLADVLEWWHGKGLCDIDTLVRIGTIRMSADALILARSIKVVLQDESLQDFLKPLSDTDQFESDAWADFLRLNPKYADPVRLATLPDHKKTPEYQSDLHLLAVHCRLSIYARDGATPIVGHPSAWKPL